METLSLRGRNGADRLRLVETQHDALRQEELVVNAVLRDVPGAQVLADKQRTTCGSTTAPPSMEALWMPRSNSRRRCSSCNKLVPG